MEPVNLRLTKNDKHDTRHNDSPAYHARRLLTFIVASRLGNPVQGNSAGNPQDLQQAA
jgi:hypothetical protein